MSANLFTLLSCLYVACVICPPTPVSPVLLFFFTLPSVQLLEAQADYHRKSLTVLENVLPTIQAQQGSVTLTHTHTQGTVKETAISGSLHDSV